jgi:hypothetical protein
VTNIGHRDGWGKLEHRLCIRCMDAADAQGIANIYLPGFYPDPRRTRK